MPIAASLAIAVLSLALAACVALLLRERRDSRRLQEQIKAQATEIDQSKRMIDVGWIASGVAHDINNALFAILGTVQMLLRSEWPPKVVGDFQRILQAAQLCKHIVSNLLSQARDSDLHREPCDIHKIIDSIIPMYELDFINEGIRVVRDYAPEKFAIAVSRPHIQRLLLNLLSNSWKAMPKGGTITVRTRVVPSRFPGFPADVKISIEDTGPGIPAQMLQDLFNAFVTKRAEGTGLGLFLCRKIAIKHGGMIEADNKSEGGACFTLTLPTCG